MLALAEILALIILNALIQAALARWKIARRARRQFQPAQVPVSIHYPLHPSPAVNAMRFDVGPEHAIQVCPAGIDW